MNIYAYVKIQFRILSAMRRFLDKQNFIEVHTPLMVPALIPERHIDVFVVHTKRHNSNKSQEYLNEGDVQYLIPSPEVNLKPLLASIAQEKEEKCCGIYEFAHSFRREEISDNLHKDEFLLLEWYRVLSSFDQSILDCVNLLYHVTDVVLSETIQLPLWLCNFHKNFKIIESIKEIPEQVIVISVEEAFKRYTDIPIVDVLTSSSVQEALSIANIADKNISHYDMEDVFLMLFTHYIEPRLPKDAFVFITKYPNSIPTLAIEHNSIWTQRWELYIGGVEIANCYSEQTDIQKIKDFFHSQYTQDEFINKGSRRIKIPYPVSFLEEPSLPPCSGVALGIDRLIMVLCGMDSVCMDKTFLL